MTRERYVAGQAPDWRTAKPGHMARPRRLPRSVRRALRDYRRKVVPMADEPRSLIDSWPFLVCGLVIGGGLLWARSQGWLP